MRQKFDVIVIGGGPAGLQAAISAATDGLTVLVLEKGRTVGGQIGNTPRLENVAFVNESVTGPEFANTMGQQAERLGVRIVPSVEIERIQPSMWAGFLAVKAKSREVISGRYIVLALGKRWTDRNILGMTTLQASGHAYAGPVMCLRDEYKGKDVGVLGGGPAAAQAILELAGKAKHVHVFVRSGMTAPLYLLDRLPTHANITIHGDFSVTAVAEVGDKVGIYSSDERVEYVDCIFACNGLTPDTEWVEKSGIRLDESPGQIVTDLPSLETSIPNVFAVGDCRRGSVPRVTAALGDGANVVSEIWQKINDTRECTNCERIFA